MTCGNSVNKLVKQNRDNVLYEEHTLNLVMPPCAAFLILTEEASFRRAVRRKSLISLICLGCAHTMQ